jgi:hypothetical protein
MARLSSLRDHRGTAEGRKQEQEQRCDIARVVHPKAVIGLSKKEITGKPSYDRCDSSALETPPNRGENDRYQVAKPDQVRRKDRVQGK